MGVAGIGFLQVVVAYIVLSATHSRMSWPEWLVAWVWATFLYALWSRPRPITKGKQ